MYKEILLVVKINHLQIFVKISRFYKELFLQNVSPLYICVRVFKLRKDQINDRI